jgi:hypothetical protein
MVRRAPPIVRRALGGAAAPAACAPSPRRRPAPARAPSPRPGRRRRAGGLRPLAPPAARAGRYRKVPITLTASMSMLVPVAAGLLVPVHSILTVWAPSVSSPLDHTVAPHSTAPL